jgi:hypothetical protein
VGCQAWQLVEMTAFKLACVDKNKCYGYKHKIRFQYTACFQLSGLVFYIITSWKQILKADVVQYKVKCTGKSKVVPEHHAMKTYWGVEVWHHTFLTSKLDGGEWSASRPGRFSPRERVSGTHWIGCWVGPRPGLDVVDKVQTKLFAVEIYYSLIYSAKLLFLVQNFIFEKRNEDCTLVNDPTNFHSHIAKQTRPKIYKFVYDMGVRVCTRLNWSRIRVNSGLL